MIIGMSHEDKKKLMEGRKKKEIKPRKNRTAILSGKSKDQAQKNFEKMDLGNAKDKQVVIDPHVKMNDNYLRTGWYKPIKKK